MRSAIQSALAGTLLFTASCVAQATLITWTLQDVARDDGIPVEGFFTFDPVTLDNPPSWQIGGAGNSESPDNPQSSASFSAGQTRLHFSTSHTDAGNDVELRFDGNLPLEGGIVPIAAGSYTAFHAAIFNLFQRHPITSGTVIGVPIPEPAGYAFFVPAVVFLLLWQTRS